MSADIAFPREDRATADSQGFQRTEVENPSRFSVTSEVERGVNVIAVRGELDLSNASQLAACLGSADGGRTIVDFGACEFIDSTGIALLIDASRRAEESGGRMLLCGLRNQVHRVLEIAGVEDQIPTKADRAAALAAAAVR